MAADKLKYAIGNGASTTSSASISNSDTSISLTSDTAFSAKSGEGMIIIDEGQSTEEFAYATGKIGASLTIPLANRGLEGGSAQAHSSGATVKGILTAGMWNDLIDSLKNVLDKTTGAVDTTKVVTPSATQTLTNKTIDYNSNTITNLPTTPNDSWIDVEDNSTITLDLSNTTSKLKFRVAALEGNRTLALSNESNGKAFIVRLLQDSTGSRTVTWFGKSSNFATSDVNTGTDVITVGRDIDTATPITFSTTDTLPSPLAADTTYYAINVSSTTLKVAASLADAQEGTAVNITDAGAGTHTIKTHIRWDGDTEPVLTTGKYRADIFGFIIEDATAGIYYGFTIAQNV